ncbi:hypothetical protein COOONC_15895 [Cooperia oncophora]
MADQSADAGDSPLKQIATKYFLSCTAALVAETVTYPLDITKTRLQITRNKHTKGGMFRVTYDIVRREGALSLWTGVGPAITRHYIYTGIRMGAYESLRGMVFQKNVGEKTFRLEITALPGCDTRSCVLKSSWLSARFYFCFMKDNWVTHALASACAGLSAAVVSLPSDVVKTRMMDQIRHELDRKMAHVQSKHVQLYNGCIDCFVKIVRQEGFFSLYKGFLPSYIRMAPWSLTFWVSYEEIRKFVGAPSF